jgi:single-stranded-DNA-specific exonuclease
MTLWQSSPRIQRREPPVDPDGLPAEWHPVVRRVMAARGVGDARDLDMRLTGLYAPQELGGMEAAVALLSEVVAHGGRITVVGDFDADGATGSALAVLALRSMGATDVSFVVPNRFAHGYGLSPGLVRDALVPLEPDLVITVDNGVSSVSGVDAAREAGMRVIVTDHHLPGDSLPRAHAMVNPNLPDDPFPSKALAGVGVVFYLMAALRSHLRESNWFSASRPEPELAALLDLVALGTVADLVPLDRHNRILVEQGLRRIRAGRAQPGVAALIQVAGRDPGRLTTADLGFAVGPRLNAAGRLEDMSYGIECLLEQDPGRAMAMAQQLDGINRERRTVQHAMQAQAEEALATVAGRLRSVDLPWGVSLFEPGWHPGVVGLVASRVKDRLHRPVVAFAPAESGSDELKGSARSVRSLHIRDTLANLDARHPGLVTRFGGHAMAAGLSLPRSGLDQFREAFDREVRKKLAATDLEQVILTDGELDAEDFRLDLAERLRMAAPWGQGFPEPRFDGVFRVRDSRTVGGAHLKLRLEPEAGGRTLDGIAFQMTEAELGDAERIRAAYVLDVNEFRNRRSVQLRIEYLEPL